jgi:hypothetical protein
VIWLGLARVSHLNFVGLDVPCHHTLNIDNVTVSPECGNTCGSSDNGILLIVRRDLYAYEGRVIPGFREWSARSVLRSTLDAE